MDEMLDGLLLTLHHTPRPDSTQLNSPVWLSRIETTIAENSYSDSGILSSICYTLGGVRIVARYKHTGICLSIQHSMLRLRLVRVYNPCKTSVAELQRCVAWSAIAQTVLENKNQDCAKQIN